MNPQLINWLLLMCLVLLWGTSFMFTAIAVDTFSPLGIVAVRVALGAVVLTFAAIAKGIRIPLQPGAWAAFFLLGAVGNLLPFYLITWGQQTIDSGMTGVIMAVMPLITMLLAHYHIPGEDLNRYKLGGFALGMTGIVLLLGPVLNDGTREMLSAIAVFVAACSYAVNTILVRLLPRHHPLAAGAGMLIASSIIAVPTWLNQSFPPTVVTTQSVAVLVWLGVGPTGIATLIYFTVIARAGPTFLSTINYLIPAVAYFTGAWLLSEPVSTHSLVALCIILCGIGLTRYRA